MAEHDSRAVASGGLLCSCRKAVGEFCPDVAVAGGDDDSLSIELTDEMKQFLVRSKRRRIERQEQRRAADAERARREYTQEREKKSKERAARAILFGSRVDEIDSLEQQLSARFDESVRRHNSALWPAVALSFGR
ncbi:hypothetical protein PBRA_003204 [Plasmodiophora brassicae]|nr:hypothetical protein PBRA_003204 [Plasmodiophora brassicae]